MKYLFWATLFIGLLGACAPATETVTSVPLPNASPTIHPLYQEREGEERIEPRPTTTAFPSRTPEATTSNVTTEIVEQASTTESEVESEAVTVEPTEEVVERQFCAQAEQLADVLPPAYVLPGPWPKPEPSMEVLSRVSTAERYINLSFDAEQDPAPVTALLEVLQSHGIFTNFFVLGSWAEENPGLVSAIAEAGHEIGNHSYSHERMAEWPAADIIADLERSENILLQISGINTRPWLRPPFGNRSEASVQTTFEAGWTTVTWSNGSNDFVDGTPEEIQESICADLLEGAEAGAILISHTFNDQTPMAVDRFIREMHSSGFVFLPLSVLTAEDPASFIVTERP